MKRPIGIGALSGALLVAGAFCMFVAALTLARPQSFVGVTFALTLGFVLAAISMATVSWGLWTAKRWARWTLLCGCALVIGLEALMGFPPEDLLGVVTVCLTVLYLIKEKAEGYFNSMSGGRPRPAH